MMRRGANGGLDCKGNIRGGREYLREKEDIKRAWRNKGVHCV